MTEGVPLAGRLRRLGATFIDAVLVPSLTLFLVMVTGVVEHAEDFVDDWWMLQVLVLAIVSYLVLNGYGLWQHGQTRGKRIMGIAIVSARPASGDLAQPQAATLWKLICLRALFFPLLFVVILPVAAILPGLDQLLIFGRRRRCLHDLVAGTIVVKVG
jgi:uncharacterized RDD family membrane protein YckC